MAKSNSASRKKSQRRKNQKRGIILLVVISLLTLFVLLGVTYALVATQYKDAAGYARTARTYDDSPEQAIDNIFQQLLVGSVRPSTFQQVDKMDSRSSIGPHCLLADLYSSVGSVRGNVIAATLENNNQTLRINFGRNSPFSNLSHYYAGRVFTFTDGPAAGQSTRVMGYLPTATPETIFVETFDNETQAGPAQNLASYVNQLAGSHFIINGAPFNGTGAGFNPNSGNLDYTIPIDPNDNSSYPCPVALMPHFAPYPFQVPYNMGGEDESWDAPDLQNMALAMVPPGIATNQSLQILPSFHRPELVNYWRKRIINDIIANTNGWNVTDVQKQQVYFFFPYSPDGIQQTSNRADVANDAAIGYRDTVVKMKQLFIFRPLLENNPNFTGSNPNFHLINGPWDVDNDGDGIAESIWIDPGLPMVTAANGRRYKKLTSILVKDLDGRANVNAHGSLQQYAASGAYRADQPSQVQVGLAPPSGGMYGNVYLPHGIGYGPAEVDILSAFGNITDANAIGVAQSLMQQRFGVNGYPGSSNGQEPLAAVKDPGMPRDYVNQPLTWYASPPDVWGRGAIALDYRGQPVMPYMGMTGDMITPSDTLHTPYEMKLVGQPTGYNAPYTVAELEPLLRYNDLLRFNNKGSTAFQSRIYYPNNMANYIVSSNPGTPDAQQRRRELLTTISSHIPAPPTVILREMFGQSAYLQGIPSPTILDLYYARLQIGGVPNNPAIQTEINKIVPWEIRHGQKFDINRFLGNGVDDDNNNVVDNPFESQKLFQNNGHYEYAWNLTAGPNYPGVPSSFTNVVGYYWNDLDIDNNGTLDSNDFTKGENIYQLNRQVFARHLFCLMMLLTDNGNLTQGPNGPYGEPGLNANQLKEIKIRRIAQWAINVVDFRDADSIMTPFEYDVNPFNGWQVDGDLTTDGSMGAPEWQNINGGAAVQTGDRRVVWGMEYPELVITETSALHDRRVKDTKMDDNTGKERGSGAYDPTLDQFRIPQGSLFVELLCTRNGAKANSPQVYPRELYTNANGVWQLEVDKMAPASDDGQQRPVWRLAITDQLDNGDTFPKPKSALTKAQQNPDSALFSTSFLGGRDYADIDINNKASTPTTLPIDRYVWFTTANEAAMLAPEVGRTFYNNNGWAVKPQPGQYVVVGPRATTYLGSVADASMGRTWTDPASNSPQSVTIANNATGLGITDLNGTTPLANGANIKGVVGVVADMNTPAGWANPQWRVGLNISEPLPTGPYYYPQPNAANDGRVPVDCYTNPVTGTKTCPDQPLDTNGGNAANLPIAKFNMGASGTYKDCRSIMLQRLANPIYGWHPQKNPYITIDWAGADLTVFTGEESTNRQIPDPNAPMAMINIDAADDPPASPNAVRPYLGTRQRGLRDGANNPRANLWYGVTQSPQQLVAGPGGSYFNYSWALSDNPSTNNLMINTFGFLNGPLGSPAANPPDNDSIGAGKYPFPWFTWNNRPFSNPMELFLVPAETPDRMFMAVPSDYALAGDLTDPSEAKAKALPRQLQPYDGTFPAFRHLLNFHQSIQAGGNFTSGTYTPPNSQAPQYSRLLDFVETPSPFIGTEKWYDPNPTVTGSFGDPSTFGSGTVADTFRAPFNKLSRFRDPGRININTVFDSDIISAAFKGLPDFDPQMNGGNFLDKLIRSRQGYNNPLMMNDNAPTLFANPFRAACSSDLMPDVQLPSGGNMRKTPAEAGFLRPDPDNPLVPLFRGASDRSYNSADRNPYFQFQPLQKVGNIFSTTSNCYAIWITIGYFEVEDNLDANGVVSVDAAHPDGARLAQELGADTGEITRNRAFYIIDRSIPVAYEPGHKHNTDKCILLRRFIE